MLTERKRAYELYINSSKWAGIRKLKIEQAGRCCTKCGSEHRLEVHHLTYERFGDEDLADLQVLCRRCHRKQHKKKTSSGPHKKAKQHKAPRGKPSPLTDEERLVPLRVSLLPKETEPVHMHERTRRTSVISWEVERRSIVAASLAKKRGRR